MDSLFPKRVPCCDKPHNRRRVLASLLAMTGIAGCSTIRQEAVDFYASARDFLWGGEDDPNHPVMMARQHDVAVIVHQAQEQYLAETGKIWGEDAAIPSRTVWIHYDAAMRTRAVMDFEGGQLRAETLLEPGENRTAALARLEATVQGARMASAADLKALDGTRTRAEAIAADQGVILPGSEQTFSTTPLFEDVLPIERLSVPATSTTVSGADGKTREKLSAKVPFKKGYAQRLAAPYAEPVLRLAPRHEALPSLVLAIMRTESAFNPRATSHIPAYGLMQIVPSSAGLDAYDFVHGMMRLLGPEYLYDPDNNIELGTAYLWILDGRYLASIENPESRKFCVIAAYNTGAGNVARTFTGTTSVRRAAPVINALTPEQVYARLERDLPFEETRRYLGKVTAAEADYLDWNRRVPA